MRQLDQVVNYLRASSGRLPVMYAHDIEGDQIKDHISKKFLFADRQTVELVASHHPSHVIRQLINERVLSQDSDVKLDGVFRSSIRDQIVTQYDQKLPEKTKIGSKNTYKMFSEEKVLVK